MIATSTQPHGLNLWVDIPIVLLEIIGVYFVLQLFPFDPRFLRGLLGQSINRFSHSTPEKLDDLLVAAARALRQGWRGIVSSADCVLLIAVIQHNFDQATAWFPAFPGRLIQICTVLLLAVTSGLIGRLGLPSYRRALLRKMDELDGKPLHPTNRCQLTPPGSSKPLQPSLHPTGSSRWEEREITGPQR